MSAEKRVTVHAVLAGAYKGGRQSLQETLVHGSLDEGRTALCGRVQEDNLADSNAWIDAPPEITCKACLAKVKREGLTVVTAACDN